MMIKTDIEIITLILFFKKITSFFLTAILLQKSDLCSIKNKLITIKLQSIALNSINKKLDKRHKILYNTKDINLICRIGLSQRLIRLRFFIINYLY